MMEKKFFILACVACGCFLIVGFIGGSVFTAATKAAKVVDMVDNSKERVAKDYNDASNAVREKGGDVMENVDAEELGDGATEGVKDLGRSAKEGLKDIGRSWKDKLKGKESKRQVEAATLLDELVLDFIPAIEKAVNEGNLEDAKRLIEITKEKIRERTNESISSDKS
jgi:hypothetical protein